MSFSRRRFLAGAAAMGAAGLSLPRVARAVAPRDRKFIFVWADGGWDVTRVFAPVFSSAIDREPADEAAHVGNLRYITNPNRPLVDSFFARRGAQTAMINGLFIRSVNHPICRTLWMTASPSAARPDWPTIIGHAAADRFVVPHFIVRGFSMAGDLSAFTAVSGSAGALEILMSGYGNVDTREPYRPFPTTLAELADQRALERAITAAAGARTDVERRTHEAHAEALGRLVDFKVATEGMDLATGDDFVAQTELACTVLAGNVARCVQLMSPGTWDTHGNNALQEGLFEYLFGSLDYLLQRLDETPGTAGGTLLDETTVVVLSEMGRTPRLNTTGGRDHWMYTSAMMFGSGIRGDHQLGGFDPYLNGVAIDYATGQPDPRGLAVTPDALGSTLLTLAGIDPVEHLGADTTLRSLLS